MSRQRMGAGCECMTVDCWQHVVTACRDSMLRQPMSAGCHMPECGAIDILHTPSQRCPKFVGVTKEMCIMKVAPTMSARYNAWEMRGSLFLQVMHPAGLSVTMRHRCPLYKAAWFEAVSQPGATRQIEVAERFVDVGPGCQRNAGPGRGVCYCAASGGARRQLGTSCQHHRLHLQVTTVHFVHLSCQHNRQRQRHVCTLYRRAHLLQGCTVTS